MSDISLLSNMKLAIIGLGYVGPTLAFRFCKIHKVVGFDINPQRIYQLKAGHDFTLETEPEELKAAKHLIFSINLYDLKECNCFIVIVPNPIDQYKRPDLWTLLKASESVGEVLKPGGHCYLRIHRVPRLHIVGLRAYSRKVQRPQVQPRFFLVTGLNIALINELAVIFNPIGIDTEAVLEAAGSKWNFLPFRSGLVGGHCIGVDPYYLTYKAESIGYHPQTIYLADSTIEENIALGVPKVNIDPRRVGQAAKEAQVIELIEGWPEKYKTFVGERGVRLSGGQRQRTGSASALYKREDVIIFDEATSSLDNETEQAVMKATEDLTKDFTPFIIAHRLITLKKCTRTVELEEAGVSRIGNFKKIVRQTIREQQNGKGNLTHAN